MSHHISEREWKITIRIISYKGCTILIQAVKIFSKSQYSLWKISTNVSIPILDTLLRLDWYTRRHRNLGTNTISSSIVMLFWPNDTHMLSLSPGPIDNISYMHPSQRAIRSLIIVTIAVRDTCLEIVHPL